MFGARYLKEERFRIDFCIPCSPTFPASSLSLFPKLTGATMTCVPLNLTSQIPMHCEASLLRHQPQNPKLIIISWIGFKKLSRTRGLGRASFEYRTDTG